jgi:hypothetical protein
MDGIPEAIGAVITILDCDNTQGREAGDPQGISVIPQSMFPATFRIRR